jgi:hypothetical protein
MATGQTRNQLAKVELRGDSSDERGRDEPPLPRTLSTPPTPVQGAVPWFTGPESIIGNRATADVLNAAPHFSCAARQLRSTPAKRKLWLAAK